MEILDHIFKLVVTGIVGLVWWDVRNIRNETKRDIRKLLDDQNACKVHLPKEYATKENVDRLWVRTDRHESDLAYIKGKFNGAGSPQQPAS